MKTKLELYDVDGSVIGYWQVTDCQFDVDGVPMGHQHASKECPQCGHEFCWSCAGETTLHLAYKTKKILRCPHCGHNYYSAA